MSLNYTNPNSGAEITPGGILEIGYSSVGDGFLTTVTLRRDEFTDETIYSGGTFEAGYTGSRNVSGTDEVLKFRRDAGWGDSSEFQIVLDDGATETTLNYVVAGAGDALAFMSLGGRRFGRFYLNTLRDVDVPSPNDTEVLGYDAASGKWTARAASTPGAHVLNSHSDVNTAGVTDGQALVFDSGTGTWIPGAGGGGGVSDHGALTGLGDDDHTQYHNDARGDTRYYTQAQIDAGYYTQAQIDARNLDDLNNVSAAGQSTGDVLRFDGTNWTPSSTAPGATTTVTTGTFQSRISTSGLGTGFTRTNSLDPTAINSIELNLFQGVLTGYDSYSGGLVDLTETFADIEVGDVIQLSSATGGGGARGRYTVTAVNATGDYSVSFEAGVATFFASEAIAVLVERQIVSGHGISASIGDHSDVDLSGLSDTNVLVYNSGTGNFEPGVGGGGSGDVTAGATLVENEVVVGDSAAKGVKTVPDWELSATGLLWGGSGATALGGKTVNGTPAVVTVSGQSGADVGENGADLILSAGSALNTGGGSGGDVRLVPGFTVDGSEGDVTATNITLETLTSTVGAESTEYTQDGVKPYNTRTTQFVIGGIAQSAVSPVEMSLLGMASDHATNPGGTLNVFAGNAVSGTGNGGDLNLAGGATTGGALGAVSIEGSSIDLTGPLTTNSTIDGRDVATDGGKLDNIEALADVTDTANVTAAGALMDSEVTSLAAIKSLTIPSGVTLTQDEIDAINGATTPASGNVFLTESDIGAVTDLNALLTDGPISSFNFGANDPTTLGRPIVENAYFCDTTGPTLYRCNASAWEAIAGGGAGTVDTSGTPVATDFARFTDADTIEGRSPGEVLSDLSLASNLTSITTDEADAIAGATGANSGNVFATMADVGGGGHAIEDNGTPVTVRSNLDFVGFTLSDNGTDTVVTNPVTVGASTNKSATVLSPATGTPYALFRTTTALTWTQIDVAVEGGTSLDWDLYYGTWSQFVAGTGGTAIASANTITEASPDSTTAGGSITADRWVWLEVSSVSGTFDSISVSLEHNAAGGSGQVDSVTGGAGILVDATDPAAPDVSLDDINAASFLANNTGAAATPVATSAAAAAAMLDHDLLDHTGTYTNAEKHRPWLEVALDANKESTYPAASHTGAYLVSLDQQTLYRSNGSWVAIGSVTVDDTTIEINGSNQLAVIAGGVGSTELADNAVTLAKLAPGTDGNLITFDASGDPAYVATGTSGHVLTSNGAGAAPTFQSVPGGSGGDTTGLGKWLVDTTAAGTGEFTPKNGGTPTTSYSSTNVIDLSMTSNDGVAFGNATIFGGSLVRPGTLLLFRDQATPSNMVVFEVSAVSGTSVATCTVTRRLSSGTTWVNGATYSVEIATRDFGTRYRTYSASESATDTGVRVPSTFTQIPPALYRITLDFEITAISGGTLTIDLQSALTPFHTETFTTTGYKHIEVVRNHAASLVIDAEHTMSSGETATLANFNLEVHTLPAELWP